MAVKESQLFISIFDGQVITQHVTLWFDHAHRYRVEIFLPPNQYHTYLVDEERFEMAVNNSWVEGLSDYSATDIYPWLWSVTGDIAPSEKFDCVSTVETNFRGQKHEIRHYKALEPSGMSDTCFEQIVAGIDTLSEDIPYWIQYRQDEFTNINITLSQSSICIDTQFPWFGILRA